MMLLQLKFNFMIVFKNLSFLKNTIQTVFNSTLLCYKFAAKVAKANEKVTKTQKNSQTSPISNGIQQTQSVVSQVQNLQNVTLEYVLSTEALSKCSPLMRQILHGLTSKKLTMPVQKQKIEQEVEQPDRPNNHDLQHFRHMLAGPLHTEIALDKFCLKKNCPLVLDVKYDGQRTFISFKRGVGLEMTSRNGKTQNYSYSRLYNEIFEQLMATDIDSIKLDGQIMALDKNTMIPLPLGQLMKFKKIKETELIVDQEADQDKLFLVYVFDILEKNGQNLLTSQLLQRRKHYPQIEVFKPAEYKIVHFPQERAKIIQFHKNVIERKYEGLIIKGAKDQYYTNQSRVHWKKMKRDFQTTKTASISNIQVDLIVMGANRGKSFKNNSILNSFLMGALHKGKIIPLSQVGTGFTEEMYSIISKYLSDENLIVDKIPQEYDMGVTKMDIYIKPALVFQIHAQELSHSPKYKLGATQFGGLSLRFPAFKRIRHDKGVSEATKGQDIIQLSKHFNFQFPQ